MYADVVFDHPEVKADLKICGKWYVQRLTLDGFRLDAVNHFKH
ncbi:alpha-amylase family glycosyl hydrolase, partial [Jeotgalibacillus sp. ET6]